MAVSENISRLTNVYFKRHQIYLYFKCVLCVFQRGSSFFFIVVWILRIASRHVIYFLGAEAPLELVCAVAATCYSYIKILTFQSPYSSLFISLTASPICQIDLPQEHTPSI